MKLHEYQAKAFLRESGIPVPEGRVAASPEDAERIAEEIGFPVMVKAQVLVGGRGKAGGVKMARSRQEAGARARDILGMKIKGIEVTKVLVARAVDIAAEFYVSLTIDRSSRAVQCIASASGGMEIEEIAVKEPEKIIRFGLDPQAGLVRARHFESLARAFPSADLAEQGWKIVEGMYRLFAEKDCSLVEINPCALTPATHAAGSPTSPADSVGTLVAADAKVIFDDNALYKHPELEPLRSPEEYGADEMDARASGLSYVSLDGTIGCIVNGAGLSMATMDIIKYFGGSPANFLDVGGSSNPEKVLNALRIILKNPGIEAILINIFGGITRCDDIARGILMAREKLAIPVPLVIRLIGTNEKEGRQILSGAGLDAYDDLTEAVKGVVAKAKGHVARGTAQDGKPQNARGTAQGGKPRNARGTAQGGRGAGDKA
jgi:succinyl-CoA synthetase beta subunit